MPRFALQSFIDAVRAAAVDDRPTPGVRALMSSALADPVSVLEAMPSLGGKDECVLFEDDTVSIWYCRFHPGVHVPPHEHRMSVFIGVLAGQEENTFYRRGEDALQVASVRQIGPGELLSMGGDGIHSVRAAGENPSDALHVYLGRLTAVERHMFDWDTGEAMPLTPERFEALTRRSPMPG